MPNMGRYCKAYPITSLRAFANWTENVANARPADDHDSTTIIINGKEGPVPRTLTDDDFLYLQENYVVTDGIFIDENIIFDSVTPEWIEFCRNTLAFEVPEYAKSSEVNAEPQSVNTEAENVVAAHS